MLEYSLAREEQVSVAERRVAGRSRESTTDQEGAPAWGADQATIEVLEVLVVKGHAVDRLASGAVPAGEVAALGDETGQDLVHKCMTRVANTS